MHEVKDDTFFKEVIKSDQPVVVDFFSPTCGPCQELIPVVDKLSADYKNKIKFVKISVQENPQTPSNFGVMGLPTVLFFKDGKIVEQITGTITEEKIRKSIDEKLI